LALVAVLGQLATETVSAKPIAFANGTTLMGEYGGGSMFEAQAFYAPRYFYSVGASALRLENEQAARDSAYLRVNWLLKRWNLPKAQGNVFVYGGLGNAREVQSVGLATSAGLQADFETRRVYYSARIDLNHAFGRTLAIDTLQAGWAPYAHDFDDIATFFVLQARTYRGEIQGQPLYRGVEYAALLRLFKGRTWLEVGVTQDRKPQAMLMVNF